MTVDEYLQLCFIRIMRPPGFPLFPYTTLFRSPAVPDLPPEEHQDAVDQERVLRHLVRRAGKELGNLVAQVGGHRLVGVEDEEDRKSTRLNSSHANTSYAVVCLKKKTRKEPPRS